MDNDRSDSLDLDEAVEPVRRPVLGSKAGVTRFIFFLLFAVVTAVGVYCALEFKDYQKIILIAAGCCDVVLLLLALILPASVGLSGYRYALTPDRITLYRKDEEVMHMLWAETDVSLGSYICRGNEGNPTACAKAVCFTAKGRMRNPQRFPKRALKGAGGELCVAFSKSVLRDVFASCGGAVAGNITQDGCRLPAGDVETMTVCLERLRARAAKQAAKAEKQAAKQASKQSSDDEAL